MYPGGSGFPLCREAGPRSVRESFAPAASDHAHRQALGAGVKGRREIAGGTPWDVNLEGSQPHKSQTGNPNSLPAAVTGTDRRGAGTVSGLSAMPLRRARSARGRADPGRVETAAAFGAGGDSQRPPPWSRRCGRRPPRVGRATECARPRTRLEYRPRFSNNQTTHRLGSAGRRAGT